MALTDYQKKVIFDITIIAFTQVTAYFGIKYLIKHMDPQRKRKDAAKTKSDKIKQKMGIQGVELNEYEEIIAGEILWPEDIAVNFQDIGGLENVIDDLKESVIYPLVYPEVFESISGLLGAPKGVLLHGPPGCGKTMIAKALARESKATFINLHVSTMTDKWFGESQKLVHALFSLARKLQPTIIFIDEIDSFLRERRSSDHEATSMMKAEFMTLWDGINSEEQQRIIILGATNRPYDLDKAILRRMPKRFSIQLPNATQRRKVLELILKNITLAPDFDMDYLVQLCEGYSNSDLKELARNSVMIPVRQAIRDSTGTDSKVEPKRVKVRPVVVDDFIRCLDTLTMTTSTLVPIPADLD